MKRWRSLAAAIAPTIHPYYLDELEHLLVYRCQKISLNRITKEQLPNVNQVRDSNLVKQTKYGEFKRKFNVEKKYVVELMLHTQWERGDWQMPKAGEYL